MIAKKFAESAHVQSDIRKIGNFKELFRLSRQLMKTVFTMKYITKLDFVS